MERKRICCLRRLGKESSKHLIIPFEDIQELVIGRSEDVNVCIPSDMISRKHAIFKKCEDGGWTITDNKSLNGIYINSKKLKPHEVTPLNDGDIVQIGVARAQGEKPEFVWKFYTSLKVKVFSNPERQTEPSSQEEKPAGITPAKKRTKGPDSPTTSHGRTPSKKPALKRLYPGLTNKSESPPSDLIQQRLAEQDRLAQEKIREQEKKLAEMQALLRDKEVAQENMFRELKRKEIEMKEQMEKQKVEMAEAQKKFEHQLREEYQEQLKEKEDSLVARLVEEQVKLKEERESLEQKMQNKTKVEQDLAAFTELKKEREKLDKIIQQKELEQKLLESQLKETKSENMKQQQDILKVKEDILHNFADLMETELQCAICNELFVFATSLNCSHSYCELCIEQWMETKKECPVCRAKITSHLRSIVLDSYIDKMVEHLSDEMKENRKQLVTERKAELEKRKAKKNEKAASRKKTRTSRNPVNPDPNAAGTSGVVTRSRRAVIESDSEEDSDSALDDSETSTDSDSSVEGYAYYGGYGRCYRCGRRGHWANGCPF